MQETAGGTPAPQKAGAFLISILIMFHGGEWSREFVPEEFPPNQI
jgi:hypothetical protein